MFDNFDNTDSINTGKLFDFDLVNDDMTDKQRRVLLAAQFYYTRDDCSISNIAKEAGVASQTVTYTLQKFNLLRPELFNPEHGPLPTVFRTYEDLTTLQQRIIDEMVFDPSLTPHAVSKRVDCTSDYAYKVERTYGDIINLRREMVAQNYRMQTTTVDAPEPDTNPVAPEPSLFTRPGSAD
jgi:hypothetical protein